MSVKVEISTTRIHTNGKWFGEVVIPPASPKDEETVVWSTSMYSTEQEAHKNAQEYIREHSDLYHTKE